MAADFESVSALVSLLKEWSVEPYAVLQRLNLPAVGAQFGERHGSWFLRFSWADGGLLRIVELALTNATSATDDEPGAAAFVSARAAASSDERFFAENIYERRRGISRIRVSELERWVRTAAQRASAISSRELTQAYRLGIPGTDAVRA
jgi:hypothetical protein